MGNVNDMCGKSLGHLSYEHSELLKKSHVEEYRMSRFLSARTRLGRWLENTRPVRFLREWEYNSEKNRPPRAVA